MARQLRGTDGWTVENITDPSGRSLIRQATKGKDQRIVISGRADMDPDVLEEYLVTRCLEDDLRVAMGEDRTDVALVAAGLEAAMAGAPVDVQPGAAGTLTGKAKRAKDALMAQIAYSRRRQERRALDRSEAAALAARDKAVRG